MSTTDPITDRRQRAREAGQDEFSSSYGGMLPDTANAIDAAIEVATQVKITDDIESAALDGLDSYELSHGIDFSDIIKAAFRAAGFEVVE